MTCLAGRNSSYFARKSIFLLMSDQKLEDELAGDDLVRFIRSTLEFLKEQGIDSRDFAPVLVNKRTGKVVDDFHRLKADSGWTVAEADLAPAEETILRFTLNFGRRTLTHEEKKELLGEFVKVTGMKAYQIAEITGIPLTNLYRYLPDEVKDSSGRRSTRRPYRHDYDDMKRQRDEEAKAHAEAETRAAEAEVKFAEVKGMVEVVLGEQEEDIEVKSPEQVAEEVYSQFPMGPPRTSSGISWS